MVHWTVLKSENCFQMQSYSWEWGYEPLGTSIHGLTIFLRVFTSYVTCCQYLWHKHLYYTVDRQEVIAAKEKD